MQWKLDQQLPAIYYEAQIQMDTVASQLTLGNAVQWVICRPSYCTDQTWSDHVILGWHLSRSCCTQSSSPSAAQSQCKQLESARSDHSRNQIDIECAVKCIVNVMLLSAPTARLHYYSHHSRRRSLEPLAVSDGDVIVSWWASSLLHLQRSVDNDIW